MDIAVDLASVALKRCSRCKWLKPLANFYNHKYGRFDYSPHCLLCAKLKSNTVYTPILTNEERFWKHVIKTDTCWLYGNPDKKYYGTFLCLPEAKSVTAHRYSWELANGPILDDSYVLHKCDVKQCVNPSHLFLGTPRDNIIDMVHKGRSPWQVLTVVDVKQIRSEAITPAEGRKSNYYALAAKYGVSYGAIRTAVTREKWKHVT